MLQTLKAKIDWFLTGMVVAILLACLFPNPGAKGGWMHPEVLVKVGVALIFFLHGVALSFDKLKAGTLRWPLHLIVQLATFAFFPITGWLLLQLFGRFLPANLGIGFFFLCALPSTVSSSVAMTAAARGNVPVAVFNATLSSLIGIFLTPLWIGLVVGTSGGSLPLGKVVLDLALWLLLPLIIGQLVRPVLGAWAQNHKPLINNVDKFTILLLVYTSFCDSVADGVWTQNGWSVLLPAFVGAMLIFAIVFSTLRAVCAHAKIAPADSAAVIFCGTKKTLASGVPMAHLIFGANPGLGLILLPILIYHPLQLAICGWLASRWARRADMREAAQREAALSASAL